MYILKEQQLSNWILFILSNGPNGFKIRQNVQRKRKPIKNRYYYT